MAARDHLELAKAHLRRVQAAWGAPTDWSDLALYGFYCLENAVVAASLHVSIDIRKSHPSKAEASKELNARCGLPDVSDLLVRLNDARKAVAYGDVTLPASTQKSWQLRSRDTSKRWRCSLAAETEASPSSRSSALADLDKHDLWPSQAARRWVMSFADRMCSDSNTVALLLIGSAARGFEKPNDIDLLCVYDRHRPLCSDHPLDVDLRLYAADEIITRLGSSQDLLSWALRFGRIICERNDYWNRLKETWLVDPRLPDPKVAEERARQAERIHDELFRAGDLEAADEQLLTFLTHKAWASLLRGSVHPASRPELPAQLRMAGHPALALRLEDALRRRASQQTEVIRVDSAVKAGAA